MFATFSLFHGSSNTSRLDFGVCYKLGVFLLHFPVTQWRRRRR